MLLGKQGKRKTFTIDKELVKLSLIESDIHLVIMVTKDGIFNETFESIKENITISYIYVSYEDIINYLLDLIFHKMIYDKIIEDNIIDCIEDE